MTGSKFTHINDRFDCENCGHSVAPRAKSCRNHCPRCLVSKHVDVNPGDRASTCGALMDAVGYEMTGAKGLVLLFKCRGCGAETRNVAAHEDSLEPDDYDRILTLRKAVPKG